MKIRIAGLVPESIVDGIGYRFAVFAQGCPFKCENCHNPHTHDFGGGELYEVGEIVERLKKYPHNDGVTFTGGEPFAQPEAFNELADGIMRELENKNIWCFTGYNFEELLKIDDAAVKNLLEKIDVLIDGRYLEKEASYELKFKGSGNQRFIDCKKSIKQGEVVLIEEDS